MSKLQDKCHAVGIHNPHNFFGDQPLIWYRPNGDYRSMQHAAWMVSKKGVSFEGHWMDNGNKCFSVWGREDKAKKFEEAKAFVTKQFGITEFARSPFGSYGDAGFVKARLKEIDEMYKALVKE